MHFANFGNWPFKDGSKTDGSKQKYICISDIQTETLRFSTRLVHF